MLSFYRKQIADWAWYDMPDVTSTNDVIKSLIKDTPVVISAEHQTGGRGRRGRKWQAVDGNLYFTYSQEISVAELSRYVCIVGLSLARTVKALSETADVRIKWPNDVYLKGKKLSGILIENIKDNLWAIGIGVNIVGSPQISDMPYQATSLKENGINSERTAFLAQYLEQYQADVMQYKNKGFTFIKEEWLKYALNLGQKITIKNDTDVKTGIFLALDENGYLILKMKDKEERIIAGDLFI